MNELSDSQKIKELSGKVDSFVWAYKSAVLALIVVFSVLNVSDTFAISQFRQIFMDALGPDHPLPLLTHFFLNCQGLVTCLAVLWPILGFLAAFKSTHLSWSVFVPTALLIVVIAQIVLTWTFLFIPMLEMPVGVSDTPATH